jgi:flavin reductase (DIM6/NTAB) family NADH-FMN oxidoreductase RutF
MYALLSTVLPYPLSNTLLLGCINIISDRFVEAANACSINAPHGVSEWSLSGLNPAPCTHVRPARVAEAVFSVEAKLVESREFESRATPGKKTGVLAVVEGVKFWVREDAINEVGDFVDPAVSFCCCFRMEDWGD